LLIIVIASRGMVYSEEAELSQEITTKFLISLADNHLICGELQPMTPYLDTFPQW